ncbi:MAG: metal-dependent hydrolase [Nanoarchaeota archaeon]|nr:metal-dependent hydrolase [Nanoarchaeota archaeon]
MAYAVTHILIVIVILDLLRHYVFGKKNFPRYLIVIGGIAGLLPDIDIPLGWVASFMTGTDVGLHRLFTHSILLALLFLFIGIIRHYQDDEKWAKIFYVIAFGWLVHILLDCVYGGGLIPSFFWPTQIVPTFCPTWDLYPWAESIDAILLVLWIVHEEVHSYVKDYF